MSYPIPDFRFKLEDNERRIPDVLAFQHGFTPYDNTNTSGILYSKGKYDDWCVYILKSDNAGVSHVYAVTDKYYFERLYWLGTLSPFKLNLKKVFMHTYHIYELAQRNRGTLDSYVIETIDKMAWTYYPADVRDMAKEALLCVYYGMVAEENKVNTRVGSMIKIYGLYNLLIDQFPVEGATSCICGVPAESIRSKCEDIGIIRM